MIVESARLPPELSAPPSAPRVQARREAAGNGGDQSRSGAARRQVEGRLWGRGASANPFFRPLHFLAPLPPSAPPSVATPIDRGEGGRRRRGSSRLSPACVLLQHLLRGRVRLLRGSGGSGGGSGGGGGVRSCVADARRRNLTRPIGQTGA